MPNWNKTPREYDDELVTNQVRYLGLVENMKVRRAGFPFRMTYERFMRRSVAMSLSLHHVSMPLPTTDLPTPLACHFSMYKANVKVCLVCIKFNETWKFNP